MRHYFIYILALTACLTIAGCSNDDGLAPSYADKNRFMATDSATNAVSALRNKFYWETGSYLLFNDTLRHETIGTDAAGTPSTPTSSSTCPMSWHQMHSRRRSSISISHCSATWSKA